jgi:acetoin utilization protein AcuB
MTLVSEAMNRSVVAVQPETTVEAAAVLARRTGAAHLLVLDEQTLVGILCTCDLRDPEPEEPVSERMSIPVMTVRPDTPIEDAAVTIGECAVGCLPVAVGGLILGTVSEVELERCGIDPHHPHHRHAPRPHTMH